VSMCVCVSVCVCVSMCVCVNVCLCVCEFVCVRASVSPLVAAGVCRPPDSGGGESVLVSHDLSCVCVCVCVCVCATTV
jgi:hypothetical protein